MCEWAESHDGEQRGVRAGREVCMRVSGRAKRYVRANVRASVRACVRVSDENTAVVVATRTGRWRESWPVSSRATTAAKERERERCAIVMGEGQSGDAQVYSLALISTHEPSLALLSTH